MTSAALEHADVGQRCMTKLELSDVSGYKSPSKQAQWVRQHLSIEPAIRADGRPSLTWATYERALMARRAGQKPGEAAQSEAPPNWNR